MKRIMMLLLLPGFFSCKTKEKDQPVSEKGLKTDMAKAVLTDLNGNYLNLKEYKGRVVFLNFWATWCKPCFEEMPSIQKAKQILRDESIVFLFASEETADQIREFEHEHHFNFDYTIAENIAELNIIGLPTTFIYDTAGKLVFSEMGYRKWDDQSNLELLKNIINSK